jgi:hypothetical protein
MADEPLKLKEKIQIIGGRIFKNDQFNHETFLINISLLVALFVKHPDFALKYITFATVTIKKIITNEKFTIHNFIVWGYYCLQRSFSKRKGTPKNN